MEPRSLRRVLRSSASSFMRRKCFDERGVAGGHFGIGFDHLVDVGVGHAFDGANHAGRELGAVHVAGGVDFHESAHHQAIVVGLSEQMPLESSSGSMGTARSGK